MTLDSGTERHVLAGKDFHHACSRRPLPVPLILETANGDTTISECCETTCGTVHLSDVLMCRNATTSLISTDLMADTGYTYTQGPKGTSFTNPGGTLCPLVRRGRLHFLGATANPTTANLYTSSSDGANDNVPYAVE